MYCIEWGWHEYQASNPAVYVVLYITQKIIAEQISECSKGKLTLEPCHVGVQGAIHALAVSFTPNQVRLAFPSRLIQEYTTELANKTNRSLYLYDQTLTT